MDQHIHHSNLIEGFDSERADRDSMTAWKWLIKQESLSHGIIRKLQKRLTTFQTDMRPDWRGYYRDLSMQRVWVGGREGYPPGFIKPAMEEWLEKCTDADPKQAHIEFEKIHPFVDGNGRTGRMLMWWMEIKQGKEPTLIKYEDRFDYYAWFQ